ncbi:MAG: hypothetical protein DMG05_21885, partial [Acidobacteria bacterium]
MYAWISDIQEFQHIGGTMKRVMLAIVLIVGAGFLPLLAQTTSTSILGTVTDASGAVVPGAKVTALQVGTGLKREEVTSNTGDYSFPLLNVGEYQVTVELAGFKTEVR